MSMPDILCLDGVRKDYGDFNSIAQRIELAFFDGWTKINKVWTSKEI